MVTNRKAIDESIVKEKLANEIMLECEKDGEPVTKEEALEMAEMELKAKRDCKRYEKAEKKPTAKKSATTAKPKKLDAEKVEILKSVAKQLDRFVSNESRTATNVVIVNPQKEITFNVGDNDYSLTLTKHKKKN